MKTTTTILTIALLLIFSKFTISQTTDYTVEEVLDENGKSLGRIFDFGFTDKGLLWYTKMDWIDGGLNFHDGYKVKRYLSDSNDSLSLPTNNVIYAYPMQKNDLLFMDGDFNLFDFSQNQYQKNSKYRLIIENKVGLEDYQILRADSISIGIIDDGRFLKFNPIENTIINFGKIPLSSFKKKVDSIHTNCKALVSILNLKNNQNITKTFKIREKKNYLFIGFGEIYYDKMQILKKDSLIWKLDYDKTIYFPGFPNSRISFETIFLDTGIYTLKCKTSNKSSYRNWQDKKPYFQKYHGCEIFDENIEINKYIQDTKLPYIKAGVIDDKKKFWLLCDSGIYKMTNKNDFTLYKFLNEASNIVWDKEDKLWFHDKNNIYSFSLINQEFNKEIDLSLSGEMKFDNNNNLLALSCHGDSLIILNTKTMIKQSFDIKKIIQDNAYVIQEIDCFGNIFLCNGIDKGGLYKLSKSQFSVSQYWHYKAKARGYWHEMFLENNRIYMTNINEIISIGIEKEDTLKYPLEEYTLFDPFIRDSLSNFVIAYDDYLVYYDKNKKQIIDTLRSKQQNEKFFSFYKDKNKKIWVFSNKGIYLFQQDERKLINFIPHNFEVYSGQNLIDHVYEEENVFWIRTFSEILKYNHIEQKLEVIYDINENYKYQFQFQGNLKREGKVIWFATETKLLGYNTENKQIESYGFSDYDYKKYIEWNIYNTWIEIIGNNIWISSMKGLFQFDKIKKEFKHFSEKDGLFENGILRMTQYQNILYLQTINRISRFDPKTETFINYYLGKDYTNLYNNFNAPEHIWHYNDKLIFPSLQGFAIYDPSKINTKIPNVIITDFKIFDKEPYLDTAINYKKSLLLPYYQNSFSFEFSTNDYTSPTRNVYEYKLEGFDKDWTRGNHQNRTAKYTNISPGKYIFRVNATNSDGIWNKNGYVLHITIKPPWWKTTLAYLLYFIFGFSIIYFFIKYREKKLVKEKLKLENKVKERTFEIQQQNEEIAAQRDEIEAQRDEISYQHEQISGSIRYAQKIQQAVLPSENILENTFPEHFVLFKPRDIVSGDFYWMKQIKQFTIVIAADCTGHGVPGAFMSMLGIGFLNEIVSSTKISDAGKILDLLREKIKETLNQKGSENDQKDGMDLALCVYNKENKMLHFSGAYNPLFIIRDLEKLNKNTLDKFVTIKNEHRAILTLKADRQPIAIHVIEKPFNTQKFQLEENDRLYIFSDGYADQIGGEKNKKFMSKNFKKLLLTHSSKKLAEQKKELDLFIENWKQGHEQVDDILIIGMKI